MARVLIIYHNYTAPMVSSVHSHLYSFQKYGNAHCFYWNVAMGSVPDGLASLEFDLILFHTTFLAKRWERDKFRVLCGRVAKLKANGASKAMLPQDEFLNAGLLCEFARDFSVDIIYSVMPERTWSHVYKGVFPDGVRIVQVLTGYIDRQKVEAIRKQVMSVPSRDLLLGYRAWEAEFWTGTLGRQKVEVAEQFQALMTRVQRRDEADISLSWQDRLMGDSWFGFLARCRYTIGSEGGTSVLDRDGLIRGRVDKYVAMYPNANFEEVREQCFRFDDGLHHLAAISPRHFEACMTETVQVLVEGEYNGILLPHLHYIPLKPDYSNIEQVYEVMLDDERREQMAARALRDIVDSRDYDYDKFVALIIDSETDHDGSALTLRETYWKLVCVVREGVISILLRCASPLYHPVRNLYVAWRA